MKNNWLFNFNNILYLEIKIINLLFINIIIFSIKKCIYIYIYVYVYV